MAQKYYLKYLFTYKINVVMYVNKTYRSTILSENIKIFTLIWDHKIFDTNLYVNS